MAFFLKLKEQLLENYSEQLTQAYVRLILYAPNNQESDLQPDMRHLQMFQKVEFGGGPIFKVVLEC